ncbi:acyltransferase family protein [Saccharomonospora xinjiangensis]|uniref:Acyltransferase family protein n=1 Tax=Saccharomonospora xinjiangensis XJ-54 TaxID=882086 RepID=I0V022_9PSEU|nr:acyltransferase [Saccharomonospora xinjiangensis]EID53475.1 acyltransferase family protein [Saccharomonospora xinjiangensis XJ-54]
MTLSPPRPVTVAPSRDRFLDVVRALAIAAVVVQHWTMPVLGYADGTLTAGNALTTPGWWAVTWLSQVMPLVFFTGGAANHLSLSRGGAAAPWLATRLGRLLFPVLPLLAVWAVVPPALRLFGVPEQPVALAGSIAAQLLWFLGVYLITVLATPLLAAAHRRWRWAVPAALASMAALVDIARFDGVPYVGYANAVFVWLAIHQLGFFYSDGTLRALSRRAALIMSATGFGVTALLVSAGPYVASMIGMPGAPMSNMSPPAAVLVSLAVGQIGLALAARDLLTAWANLPSVAAVLGWVGPRFMTVYLWHMPALIGLAALTVLWLDYATPVPGTITWLATVPGWLLSAGALLAVLLRVFGRFETRVPRCAPAPMPLLCVAALLAATGTLTLAATGFSSAPWPWIALIVVAYALIRVPIRNGTRNRTPVPA